MDFIPYFIYEGLPGGFWWEPGICRHDQEWLEKIIPELSNLGHGRGVAPRIVSCKLLEWHLFDFDNHCSKRDYDGVSNLKQ